MRNFVSHTWPLSPLGEARGTHSRSATLAAVAIDWAHTADRQLLPLACAVVYLPTSPAKPAVLASKPVNLGFRVSVLDQPGDPHEVAAQMDMIDRELINARTHAAVLAGHDLERDLRALPDLALRPVAGIRELHQAWTERGVSNPDLARLIDIRHDVTTTNCDAATGPRLTVTTDPVLGSLFPTTTPDVEETAFRVVCRCVAVALAAAWPLDLYRWDGVVDVKRVTRLAATGTPLTRPTHDHGQPR